MEPCEISAVTGVGELPELVYRNVDPEELAARDDGTRDGCVANLLTVASRRLPGQPIVAVSNPTRSEWGWGVGRTVINVITDDMVFLVDSVAAELSRRDIAIHLLLHPVVAVVRDPSGRLLAVGDSPLEEERAAVAAASTAGPAPALTAVESWMHLEVDWQADPQAPSQLADALYAVLADVAKAVADWRPMVATAKQLATDLAASPPVGAPAEEVDQCAELLRWMAEDHFTFLGYRQYEVAHRDDPASIALVSEPGSGLGLMHSPNRESTSFASLPEQVRAKALEPKLLILTKANRRSTVHRSVYLDYVGVKSFDAAGRVVGEHRFIGLFAASAYTQSVSQIPVIDRKVRQLRDRLGVATKSHSGRDLQQFLENYPRDELFAAEFDELLPVARASLSMLERRATRLFLRTDPYQRFLSALVYLPRDRYTTAVRLAIVQALRDAIGGTTVDYTAWVTESVLSRLHFVVRMPVGQPVPAVDDAALQTQIAEITRSWEDNLATAVTQAVGESAGHALVGRFPAGFPAAYKEATGPGEAVDDLRKLVALGEELTVSLRPDAPGTGAQANVRLKLYSRSDIALAQVLPVLTSLGVQVISERPFLLHCQTAGGTDRPTPAYLYDFGLRWNGPGDLQEVAAQWEEAFGACWKGLAEPDSLNSLVAAGLRWQQINVIRSYLRYLRQAGSPFSQAYLEEALSGSPALVRLLVELFSTRCDPDFHGDRQLREQQLDALLEAGLERVPSLDQDRILRSVRALIRATLRTNYFQPDRPALACKFDPAAIPDLPLPRPRFEIWVYSPRVEGVHLRYGHVARGGLRWSDRREDFRTEILGLVKAQAVKNAVIVPVGAKGGFYAKQLPDPARDRDAWLAEGIASYRIFIGSLLDVTDNRQGGEVIPPARVVRHDGEDTYLVVAADKGTASFSDIANEVAAEYGYWLGDAFASGGSAGYDHKAMGITARGAWESVRAHLRTLGIDPASRDFTVVGIGDMSGDVFGNGMLLSSHIRLVAAFDHRHIFLDPAPDPTISFGERQRLFGLPRSSWADYDPALISAGGGVFPRTAKAIPISEDVRSVLDMGAGPAELTPNEVLRAILRARVHLLWNGGIGTYVKASSEANSQVGDRANDAIRVDGEELRVAVVGEGGNLGLTQRGRIAAARAGVLLNTDAIDNSAGVDTSDHEVNIKIALDQLIVSGRLPVPERQPLLASLTEDVAAAVLHDNIAQNTLLAFNRYQGSMMVPALRRVMLELERSGELDRHLEALPDDAELAALQASGGSLTAPELAVIVAYVKLTLKAQLLETGLPDERWCVRWLRDYIPKQLSDRFAPELGRHPLRRQIVLTGLVNEIVNTAGVTFVMRAGEETGAAPAEVARAYAVACGVFDLPGLWQRIAADPAIPLLAQHEMRWESLRLLDRATRWFLQSRGGTLEVDGEIGRFRPALAKLAPVSRNLLLGAERARLDARAAELTALGAPAELAVEVAGALDWFSLLDVVEISRRTGAPPDSTAAVYFTLSERYGVDGLLTRITALPRTDRWSALARAALRADLYSALASLTSQVIRATPAGGDPVLRAEQWERRHAEGLARTRATLAEITAGDTFDLATLSVALRTIRTLAAQGG
ncbi:MAG: NAD-glutamate dehydrogenase [Candidatus Nanopelagicales bacterium]